MGDPEGVCGCKLGAVTRAGSPPVRGRVDDYAKYEVSIYVRRCSLELYPERELTGIAVHMDTAE